MKDIGFDRLIKGLGYEVCENGLRIKFFGLPYFLTEDDLKAGLSLLHKFLERIQIMRKEKDEISKPQNFDLPGMIRE